MAKIFWKIMTRLDELIVHGLHLDNTEVGCSFCQWAWSGLTLEEDKEK